jgi:hypothetical protein
MDIASGLTCCAGQSWAIPATCVPAVRAVQPQRSLSTWKISRHDAGSSSGHRHVLPAI